MKIFFLIVLSSSLVFSSICYTAVNGFSAIGTLSSKLASKASSSANKISDLGSSANQRLQKLEKIKELQKQIREVKAMNYLKSKSILNNLKVKNALLDVEISTELTKYYFQKK